jgi:alkylation response protein AidB-like acyl-CoA dehydrogenase
MDLNHSPEELAFRDEVHAWLHANVPQDLQHKVVAGEELGKQDFLRWHKILAAKGWVAPAWPPEWGGTGWDVTRRYIFEEECGLAGAPMIVAFGVVMCAQVLLKFGTQAQKQRFLPRIYNGDDFWVQGYSEPGAGSDLASLQTRAERHGDSYIVNGQKCWTSLAQHGDWIFCLVRTNAQGRKQEGISFLLIDLRSPGITVRPVHLMDGGADANEVFFDNVEVPVANLVHEEGQGWAVAKHLLGFERLNTGRIGISKRLLARLKALAGEQQDGRGSALIDTPRMRDRITRAEVELMALEITNLRFLDAARAGRSLGAEVSMLKIRATEIQQALSELTMQVLGPMAAPFRTTGAQAAGPFDIALSNLAPRYAGLRASSIYAGSNEIQRNILAKSTLGL